jgi:hypothetical protein
MQHISSAWVDAANARDPDGLIALFHPDAEFRPSLLGRSHQVYRGHDGVRRYFDDLREKDKGQQVELREVRLIGEEQILILAEVVLWAEVISPAGIVLDIREGKIIRAAAYLSDEPTMIAAGIIPRPS